MKLPQTTIENKKDPTLLSSWASKKNNLPNTLAKENRISQRYFFQELKILYTKINIDLHSLAAVGGEK